MNPVLILGAGVNGAALARELVINGAPVVVVDTADVASGATAASSRLIHGGLRYLEYGEFGLVRESLAERARLLRLAPHLVRPLRLFIPLQSRWSGWLSAGRRFLLRGRAGGTDAGPPNPPPSSPGRGLWVVRTGLWLYDRFARDPSLPGHRVFSAGERRAPPVDANRYHWQCAYYDAAVQFPERFVLALLEDARREAQRRGVEFSLLNYHQASWNAGQRIEVRPVNSSRQAPTLSHAPAAIVNATGAWVDRTLQRLGVASPRLMGGTKGSHFLTAHSGLRSALDGRGVYAEASDGRPVFLLPLGNLSLVGTTDEPFSEDPSQATATPAELDYLIRAANRVFPQLRLSAGDVAWHYSGVRPLPYSGDASPASITRRHWIEENTSAGAPFFSLIGGKLTTCRSLAEVAAAKILDRLGLPHNESTRERPLPGGEDYPRDEQELTAQQALLAQRFQLASRQVQAIWRLLGTRTRPVLEECARNWGLSAPLDGTPYPLALAHWMARHEWARTIEDLTVRRLMLPYMGELKRATLHQLGQVLSADDEQVNIAVASLKQRYGMEVEHEE